MIPVQFMLRDGDGMFPAGWYAMPQVPAVGERVMLIGGESPLVVADVLWEMGEVPAAVVNMRDAGLSTPSGGRRMLARVFLVG